MGLTTAVLWLPIPGWLRFIMWLAYLAGDAVAIYALATLFNRHKNNQDHGGSGTLEVVWAPVLLLHLGGHDGITALNIEDNELWSRHLLTAVSQVTVAIYVFCKSWSGSDKRLLQAAILMFVPGVLKCFLKPLALKRASIYSLVSLPAAKQQNEGEKYELLSLEVYVQRSKKAFVDAIVREQNDEGEVQGATSSVEDGDHPQSQEGRDALHGNVTVTRAWAFVRGLLKGGEGAPSQGSFLGRLREVILNPLGQQKKRVEDVHGEDEVFKLFVDLSSPYHRRLSTLQKFVVLSEEKAYGSVRGGLATAFLLLYTKLKTAGLVTMMDMKELKGSDAVILLCDYLIQTSRMVLPWASIGLFHQSHREAHDGIDVKITYTIFCCTAVLEYHSLLALMGGIREVWPEMVAQYSLIGYFARNRKHSNWMWMQIVSFFGQHWRMRSCLSSCRITKLVLGYLKDGWTQKIHDAASYRRFNDNRGHWALEACSSEALGSSIKRPFDESVLLWHIATDFCFFSSQAVSDHTCAFAEAPAVFAGQPGLICEIIRYLQTRARGTGLSVENNQSRPQCREELTSCKAVLCRQMSNYMVYLLFVNPEILLPGSRRNLFTTAHEDLEAIFKGEEPPLQMGDLILKISSKRESPNCAPKTSLIHEAWEIAEELRPKGEEKKWEVIQGVWVEMLCFSASRCRGYLHAKALGSGGEFLSYIWLLMSYMGMETLTERLQREREEPPSREGNNSAAQLTSGARNVTASSISEEIHITVED